MMTVKELMKVNLATKTSYTVYLSSDLTKKGEFKKGATAIDYFHVDYGEKITDETTSKKISLRFRKQSVLADLKARVLYIDTYSHNELLVTCYIDKEKYSEYTDRVYR